MSAAITAAVIRVLFIGNSLTYVNDLPARVADEARKQGQTIEYETVAFPDHGLEEHWNRGDALKAIRRGGWTFVVLQQGPSALPESRRLLIEYTRRFDAEIRRTGARTALYMVWPSLQRRGDTPAVIQSYTLAAEAVGALLLPVGKTFDGWGSDGFHPSVQGTQRAAELIAKGLVNCWQHHC